MSEAASRDERRERTGGGRHSLLIPRWPAGLAWLYGTELCVVCIIVELGGEGWVGGTARRGCFATLRDASKP